MTLLGGSRREVDHLLDIPLEDWAARARAVRRPAGRVPFRQMRERGFEAIDDGTPLVSMVDVEAEHEVPVDDLLAALPDVADRAAGRGGFDIDDDAYAEVVDQIIRDEIGKGEGANLVIGRHYRAIVADWDADTRTDGLPPAARARARRLLDVLLLHRRPLPDRREPGTPHQRPRRRRPDEPDHRDVPGRRGDGDDQGPAARLPRRREGDLRALHGGRRGAEDDVRHLPARAGRCWGRSSSR